MSIPALATTTLSTAIDARQTRFVVGSTSGINGLGSLTAPQSVIVVGAEAMLVQNVPVAGVVEVMRGANGTRARAHASGATVYVGAKTAFDFSRDGMDGLQVGLAGDSGTLPYYRLPVGGRVMDPNTGYEYLLVDCSAAMVAGEWCGIDGTGLASPLAAGTKGRVGIMSEAVGSSDRLAYALVVGVHTAAYFSSSVTTAVAQLIAGDNYPGQGTSSGGNVIFNATCLTAPSTASAGSFSSAGIGTAYINNPWCQGATVDIVP